MFSLKQIFLSTIALLIVNPLFAQSNLLVEYDFTSKKFDTLPSISFDSSLREEQTDFYYGADSLIDTLEMNLPLANTYPKSRFTLPKPNLLKNNSDAFPARTAVKLFTYYNDSLVGSCSGTMVSKKHVVSGSFCFLSVISDTIFIDSIVACPGYDEGSANPSFGCSAVNKAYLQTNRNSFRLWTLLELNDAIGNKTGWVSLGFTKNDSQLLQGSYHKFSYPVGKLSFDTITYSEDTMYYAFGEVNQLYASASFQEFGVNSGFGLFGEGGGSLMKVDNQKEYLIYGISTFSNNIRQETFKNWGYFAIKSVIKDDILTGINDLQQPLEGKNKLLIYPNPVADELHFQLKNYSSQLLDYQIFDSQGKKISEGNIKGKRVISTNQLVGGMYIIRIHTNNQIYSQKFIKN